jgi:BNR repeat protein
MIGLVSDLWFASRNGTILLFVFFVGLVHAVTPTGAHAQAIRVNQSEVVISVPTPGLLVEPHLAVHPSNPDHLLGAVMITDTNGTFQERDTRLTCAAVFSLDGGKTWTRHDFPLTPCYDPWLAITPDGRAVFTALGAHQALANQGPRGLVVFRSPDGGRTWNDQPLGLGVRHDHPTSVVDLSSGARRGWLFLISEQGVFLDDGKRRSGIYVVRSRNGGTTFDEPVKIVVNGLINKTEMPVVLPGGTLFVSFVDVAQNLDPATGMPAQSDRRRAWVVRSTDGGNTFSTPLFVGEECGPPPAFQLSSFAADVSNSSFQNRLYFACRQKGGGPIVLSYSTDAGENWTRAVPVHAADAAASRIIPAVAVNSAGVLGVARLERRGQSGDRCHEVYFTASVDGGRTFLPEQRVSSIPCADSPATAAAFQTWPTSGDYFGIVSTPDGRFRLLWAEPRDGASQLRTVTVEVDNPSPNPR